MPLFDYKVKNKNGELLKGQVSVESRSKLLRKFDKEGLTPIEVVEVDKKKTGDVAKKEKKKGRSGRMPSIGFDRGVTDEEKAFFTRQFATMLNAGLTLDRIINILYKQARSKKMADVLYQLGSDLQKGSSITDSISKHEDVFDDMYISMVKVGEKSGNLSTIFKRLADMMEKGLSIKKKIKSAMAYPAFIFVFSAILSYVFIALFLPTFIPMFRGIGLNIEKDYPLTAFLIKLSDLVTNYGFVIGAVVIVAALVFGIRRALKTKSGKFFIDKIMLNVPGFHILIRQAALSRFCRSFSYLSNSGVPVLQALHLVANASGNAVFGQAVHRVAGKVKEGGSLSQTLDSEDIFPDMVVQMVNVGEEAGSVPEMFEKTADYLDERIDNSVTALISLLEPVMMVFVGFVVGVFVLGILLPLLGITSKLG